MTKSRKERTISEAMSLLAKRRAEKLTPEERRAIATKASKAAAAARQRKAKQK